jgi:hypothetical protein
LQHPLTFIYIEFDVQVSHQLAVDEDEDHEYVDGSLLGEPEAQREASHFDVVKGNHQEDAQYIAHNEPDEQQPKLDL